MKELKNASELFIQIIILLSIVSFTIETLPDLSTEFIRILNILEFCCIIVFSVEYVIRFFTADKKFKFMFSFYGLVDLLAILPFYIATGLDLRSIRIFRLFRLLRLFKIFRNSKAIRLFTLTLSSIKNELIIFLMATLFVLYISAVGIYFFEHTLQPEGFSSIFHCLWWAVATLTTVGYGDVYPLTVGGQLFTFLMLMVGLGIIAVPTGLIASSMTNIIADEKKSTKIYRRYKRR